MTRGSFAQQPTLGSQGKEPTLQQFGAGLEW